MKSQRIEVNMKSVGAIKQREIRQLLALRQEAERLEQYVREAEAVMIARILSGQTVETGPFTFVLSDILMRRPAWKGICEDVKGEKFVSSIPKLTKKALKAKGIQPSRIKDHLIRRLEPLKVD